MGKCAHLHKRYREPNGPTSTGYCLDCGAPVPSLPNSVYYPVGSWRVTSKARRMALESKTAKAKAVATQRRKRDA